MKIVFDTNVILAAFISRGISYELFEYCIKEHEVYISDFIIEEVKEKLEKKLKVPKQKIKSLEKYIISLTKIVEPVYVAETVFEDKDDLPVIGTAMACNAEILITGDKKLEALQKIAGIKIIFPRKAWELLTII